MSRTSTATVRESPLADAASATGAFTVRSQNITIDSRDRVQIFDLTDDVRSFVRESGVREGLLNVSSLHTTCAVFLNEAQDALLRDVREFLERTVEADGPWAHNNPVHSDCDRGNADSHLRAMLLGHTLTLQVSGGDAVLGQWQRVLVAELDGARARTLRLSIMGVA